jgi:hypothetical protein
LFATNMKSLSIRPAVGVILLVSVFVAGALFQYARNGFFFAVLAEKQYGASADPIRWRLVNESVGMPFVDLGTTIIEYRGRTIYKAQRIFQESFPVAENIKVTDKQIDWDDGELRFHLTVEEMKKGEPNGAGNRSQPVGQETNRTSSAAGSGA